MNASTIGNTGSPVSSSPATTAENTSNASKSSHSPFKDTTIRPVSPDNSSHGLTRTNSTHSLSEFSFSEAFKNPDKDPGSSSTDSLSNSDHSSSFSSIASGDSDDSTHDPESPADNGYGHYVDPATGRPVDPDSELPHDPWAKK